MNEFDEKAKSWDDDVRVTRAQAVAQVIREQLPLDRDMTALEYGCGTGLLSFGLMDDLGQITLADSSDGMLEVLREKIASIGAANMHPLRFDLTVDPPPLERFDLVYNLMTLHHIPDVDGALASFYAMLHAGGWLAICDLDTEDGSFHDPGVDVHHGFDRNDLATRLRNVGFVDIRSLTAHDIQREREGVERRYPLFLLVGRRPAA